LEKHQNILNNDASLGIFANDNVRYFTTARDPEWKEIEIQVETPNMTRVGIVLKINSLVLAHLFSRYFDREPAKGHFSVFESSCQLFLSI